MLIMMEYHFIHLVLQKTSEGFSGIVPGSELVQLSNPLKPGEVWNI